MEWRGVIAVPQNPQNVSLQWSPRANNQTGTVSKASNRPHTTDTHIKMSGAKWACFLKLLNIVTALVLCFPSFFFLNLCSVCSFQSCCIVSDQVPYFTFDLDFNVINHIPAFSVWCISPIAHALPSVSWFLSQRAALFHHYLQCESEWSLQFGLFSMVWDGVHCLLWVVLLTDAYSPCIPS